MFNQIFRNFSLFFLLLTCIAAWADDNSLSVVGPTGRSSFIVADSFRDYKANQVLRTTLQLNGSVHNTINTATLGGYYAVNDRVTIFASLPWTTASSYTSNWGATSQTKSRNGLGDELEVSAVLAGDTFGNGFRLVGNLGSLRAAQYSPQTYVQLQPMYWFSKELLLSANVGAGHQTLSNNFNYNYQSAHINLLWYAMPQLSIMPSVGLEHVNSSNTYSGYNNSSIGLTSTYHVDNNWSAFVGLSWMSQSARNTNWYANDVVDGREYSISFGIRRLF
jgi:hypothetical protein